MKVALYARVSKLHSHQDTEVQMRELREWSSSKHHKIIDEYVDRGVSGIKKSRPGLDRMMRDATRGLKDIDAVVVWRLDRFGRSIQHLHNAVAELHEAKVQFISVKEGFDLSTPMGKLFFAMLAAFAEFERNIIAERIDAGLRTARAKGHKPGRKIDVKRGPSRTTLWRQRNLRKSA